MTHNANTVALFAGDCGHRWIGLVSGSYVCPVCGRHDGDHHLELIEPLPVQGFDWVPLPWGETLSV